MSVGFEEQKWLTAYSENPQTFRSLDKLMWSVPLLSMTLTGGLWFGASLAGG